MRAKEQWERHGGVCGGGDKVFRKIEFDKKIVHAIEPCYNDFITKEEQVQWAKHLSRRTKTSTN